MTTRKLASVLLGALMLIGAGCAPASPPPAPPPPPPAPPVMASFDDLIEVSSPLPNALVSSPLTVTGRARGGWYFEAIFPVELRDAGNNVIATGTAQAQGDWMTGDYVPFTATLTFSAPASATGTLVLKNSNMSGEPALDKQLLVPVTF